MRNNTKSNTNNYNKNNTGKSKSFAVAENDFLLEFLFKNVKGKSASKIKSILKHKLVSVNGKVTTKFDYPLRKGQTVEVASYKAEYNPKQNPDMPEIIFEDENIIVIDKPAGMLAIATDTEKTKTAHHAVMEYVRLQDKDNRVYIVHRLDRETSGILLFAKSEEIKYALQDNWNDIVKFRGYSAVIEGSPDENSGQIRSYLRETDTHFVYSAKIEGDGKLSITNYEVVLQNEDYSLVAVNLETGRKNQIRVHFSEMGCPIAGDKKYGSLTNPIRRLALCADRLVLTVPYLDEDLEFKLPVPKKFLTLLKG